jgi:hypothetical protein
LPLTANGHLDGVLGGRCRRCLGLERTPFTRLKPVAYT